MWYECTMIVPNQSVTWYRKRNKKMFSLSLLLSLSHIFHRIQVTSYMTPQNEKKLKLFGFDPS
jgi:hypothetical protein